MLRGMEKTVFDGTHKQDNRGAIADFQVEVIVKTRYASDGDVGAVNQSDGIKRSQYGQQTEVDFAKHPPLHVRVVGVKLLNVDIVYAVLGRS